MRRQGVNAYVPLDLTSAAADPERYRRPERDPARYMSPAPCRPVATSVRPGRCRGRNRVQPGRLRTLVPMRKRWQSGVSERAAELESLRMALHRAYDARDGSAAATRKWHDAAAAFRSAAEAFYAPYEQVLAGIRAGRTDSIEEATRYLAADPWCFRSGYRKADLMHALANAALPDHVVPPLREVVLHHIIDRQPGLLRYAAQLAANVWDQDLEAQITRLEREGTAAEQRAAAQVSARARQRLRSLDVQVGRPVAS